MQMEQSESETAKERQMITAEKIHRCQAIICPKNNDIKKKFLAVIHFRQPNIKRYPGGSSL